MRNSNMYAARRCSREPEKMEKRIYHPMLEIYPLVF
jgi:hypothetical protein